MINIIEINEFKQVHNYLMKLDSPYFFDCDYNTFLNSFINDSMTNIGVGSKCMNALKNYLYNKGIKRFDTDTALNNVVAQHFYEKNGFISKGITRSYYLK